MTYQEQQQLQERQPERIHFATIDQVYEDGVTLLFYGQSSPSQKRYQCNRFAVFHAGDRVFLAKDSGTYIVLFPIGAPKSSYHADTAGSADAADTAVTAEKAAQADRAEYAQQAGTASQAEKADRLTTSRTISLTGDVTASGSFSGASNLSMAATGVKAGMVKDQYSPSNRTIQFRVASSGKLQFKSSYYDSGSWYNMDGSRA